MRGSPVLWAAAWVLCGTLLCGTLEAHRLPVHVMTTAQGLPRNAIGCLVPGLNGMMWMCSSEGLARFDGYNIRVFGQEEGLPSRVVFDMAPAHGGGYWLVTAEGVCRLKPGAQIGEPCSLFAAPAGVLFLGAAVHESATGETWLGTNAGVHRVDPVRRLVERSELKLPAGEELLSMEDGPAGSLLLGSATGIYEWQGPGHAPRRLNGSFGEFGVSSIFRLASGAYWLGTNRGIVYLRFEGAARTPVFAVHGLKGHPRIQVIYRGPSERIWVVSDETLLQVAVEPGDVPRMAAEFGRNEGLPEARIMTIVEDGQGTLWGATDGAGVFRLEDSGISSYYGADGLGTGRIASIFEDRSGTLCVMTAWDGVADLRAFDGRRFQSVHIPYPAVVTGHGWGWNQYGLQATDGEWWFPSAQGLLRYAATSLAGLPAARLIGRYGADSPVGAQDIFRTYQDSAGDIWVACVNPRTKVVRWERRSQRFVEYPVEFSGPEPPLVLAFREGRGGSFWLGTNNGLFRMEKGKFVRVDTGGGPQRRSFRDILFDHEGRLWAGMGLYGLLRSDNPNAAKPTFTVYSVKEGLSANSVRALAEDRRSFIYVCTVKGVDRLDPRAGPGEHRIRHLSAADGLPDNEPNAAFTDSHGSVWVGTLRGLARIDPGRAPHLTPPEPFITRLRVRGEDIPIDWDGARRVTLELSPERNQIEVSYAVRDARPVAAVRFQYRLAGSNGDWSPPSNQLSVNYPQLPRGQLRFEVRGVDADGQAGANVAAVELHVWAPMWQRWWFLLLAGAVLAALATYLYTARVRHLLAIANLRTHIATDLHDDIGANLTQIAILSEVAHRNRSAHLLEEISTIARDTVAQMSDIVWAVSPSHDRFDSLLHRMRRFAEDTLGGVGIEVTFETAGLEPGFAIPLEARRPLFLIFKESINNVARHSGAARATAIFDVVRGSIRMVITDDGRGFVIRRDGAGFEGEGISSISRRAAKLGGRAEWTGGPGAGTCITVTIPMGRRRRWGGTRL